MICVVKEPLNDIHQSLVFFTTHISHISDKLLRNITFSYLQKMEEDSKSVREMELVVSRKTDHKEILQSDEWLYSEKYSIDSSSHTSLMISGLLMLSGIGHFYRLIKHAIPHLNIKWY